MVRNAIYDLLVTREENGAPVEIVDRGERVPEPRRTLETSLVPNARYFWTVRARFDIDGRARMTEWSTTDCCRGALPPAPSDASYLFTSPQAPAMSAVRLSNRGCGCRCVSAAGVRAGTREVVNPRTRA